MSKLEQPRLQETAVPGCRMRYCVLFGYNVRGRFLRRKFFGLTFPVPAQNSVWRALMICPTLFVDHFRAKFW